MVNRKKLCIVIGLLVIFISTFGGIIVFNRYENGIDIIELTNTTKSQMMGYVIKTKNNELIVVDGGIYDDYSQLASVINENGGKVNHWFITHPHNDHVGTFTKIVSDTDIPIDNIYISLNDKSWYIENEPNRKEDFEKFFSVLNSDKILNKVHEVGLNEIINIDNLKVEILGIKNPEITVNSGNNSSMVFKFFVNDKSLLFLGDTGTESSNKLIEMYKDNSYKLKSDVVQIAHHGQRGATEELYNIINPSICLWPTTDWLWYNDSGEGEDSGNWKTKETYSWIKKLNVDKNYLAISGIVKFHLW